MTGEILKNELLNRCLVLSDIAKRLGMSPQHRNQALNAADIKSGLIERICDVLGLSIAEMYHVPPVIQYNIKEDEKKDINESVDETRPRIPQTVAAGSLSGFSDGVILPDCEQVPVIKAFPPYDYTMIVKGDSMEPKFEGGDEIAIRRVYDYIEWGKTYVLDTRDGAVLKRLYDEGDNYRCVSFNSDYPDFLVNKNDVFGVFKVVGLLRI